MDGTGNSSWVPWPTFSDEPPPIGDLDDDEDDYGKSFPLAPRCMCHHKVPYFQLAMSMYGTETMY